MGSALRKDFYIICVQRGWCARFAFVRELLKGEINGGIE